MANGTTPAADAKAKRLRKIGATYDVNTGNVSVYSFAGDGETKVGGVDFNISELPAPIQTQLAMHGAMQKLSDGTRTLESPEERVKGLQAMLTDLRDGKWAEKAPDGRIEKILAAVLLAMSQAGKEPDEEALRKALASRNAQDQALANPKVLAAYNELNPVAAGSLLDF